MTSLHGTWASPRDDEQCDSFECNKPDAHDLARFFCCTQQDIITKRRENLDSLNRLLAWLHRLVLPQCKHSNYEQLDALAPPHLAYRFGILELA